MRIFNIKISLKSVSSANPVAERAGNGTHASAARHCHPKSSRTPPEHNPPSQSDSNGIFRSY